MYPCKLQLLTSTLNTLRLWRTAGLESYLQPGAPKNTNA